jgi:hypothetical protein
MKRGMSSLIAHIGDGGPWADVTAQRTTETPQTGLESHITRDNAQRQDWQNTPGCNDISDTQEEPVLDGVDDTQKSEQCLIVWKY